MKREEIVKALGEKTIKDIEVTLSYEANHYEINGVGYDGLKPELREYYNVAWSKFVKYFYNNFDLKTGEVDRQFNSTLRNLKGDKDYIEDLIDDCKH